MNGNRGAKGSVNDRIISYLFRKRYLEYLKKKENYTVEERQKAIDYLRKIKDFDIDDNVSMLDDEDKSILEEALNNFTIESIEMKDTEKVRDLKEIFNGTTALDSLEKYSSSNIGSLQDASKKIEEFDPSKELYDFDKYDYYEIINDKTGLAKLKSDEFIDVDREIEKKDDEKIILEEVNEFIDDSLKTLDEIKYEINAIKDSIQEQYTQEQLKNLHERYDAVKEKLKKLKQQYSVIKEKYDFEDYEILENITLINSIDDYKSKANLEELELMVDACKMEIEAIDGVVIEEEKSVGIEEEMFEKKTELVKRDKNFKNSVDNTIKLNELEETIRKEASEQIKIIEDLEKSITKVETEIVRTREYVYNTGRLFGSFLRITAGILTRRLSNTTLFGTMLGNHLINRGLRELRQSMIPQEVERVEFIDRYKDVEREIFTTKDYVRTTMYLIDDSLEHIKFIKENYNLKLKQYASQISEYPKLESMINELEKKLLLNKDLVSDMNKTLDQQYEKNKVKVYNSNHPRSAA